MTNSYSSCPVLANLHCFHTAVVLINICSLRSCLPLNSIEQNTKQNMKSWNWFKVTCN